MLKKLAVLAAALAVSAPALADRGHDRGRGHAYGQPHRTVVVHKQPHYVVHRPAPRVVHHYYRPAPAPRQHTRPSRYGARSASDGSPKPRRGAKIPADPGRRRAQQRRCPNASHSASKKISSTVPSTYDRLKPES